VIFRATLPRKQIRVASPKNFPVPVAKPHGGD
jgi:hypothetical protein